MKIMWNLFLYRFFIVSLLFELIELNQLSLFCGLSFGDKMCEKLLGVFAVLWCRGLHFHLNQFCVNLMRIIQGLRDKLLQKRGANISISLKFQLLFFIFCVSRGFLTIFLTFSWIFWLFSNIFLKVRPLKNRAIFKCV